MNTYDELALAEAVAEGAAFMDAIDANVTDDAERWFWVVEPERLDMSQSTGGHMRECGCIFGQHHPDGLYFPQDYGLDWDEAAHRSEAQGMGFDVLLFGRGSWSSRAAEYAALTALWRDEINERRAAWFDAHPEAVIA